MLGHKVEADGVELQVYESGNKSGEVILFLHPQGSSAKIWMKLIPMFQEEYHIILVDLRGHGHSEKCTFGYDIVSQYNDIQNVMKSFDIKKAHLIGNSLGGDIATAFASFFPQHVLSLTNIDSGMINYIGPEGERNVTIEEVVEEFKNRKINNFSTKSELLEYVESVFPQTIWENYFEEWFKFVTIYEDEEGRLSYQIPPSINVQIMEMVCKLDYKELYKNITCPILFLPAEKEDNLSVKLKYIEEANKHTLVKTSIIPESKHLMVLNQSAEIGNEIVQFYSEINK